jgi:multidrug efflux pump subunit AcrB
MIDIDLPRLYALGLSPNDVSNAVQAQNLVLPSGTAKIGRQELLFRPNSSPIDVKDIAKLPIKSVNGANVRIGDIASVRDGFAPQTSLVRANGRRGVLMTLLKSAGASTLDIVKRVRGVLPGVLSTLPAEYKLDLLFDQSLYVRGAVEGVVKEAGIAAGLTALMILLFLGSWRSTLIVITSIPLSILVSIIVLACIGESLNLMTLGGLSLAVGILVDDATVEIENVHRNMAMKKPFVRAILDGAQQIAVPAFVATLCICIVFIPVAFISGAARSLFTPLGMRSCSRCSCRTSCRAPWCPRWCTICSGPRSTSTPAMRTRLGADVTSSGASTSASIRTSSASATSTAATSIGPSTTSGS